MNVDEIAQALALARFLREDKDMCDWEEGADNTHDIEDWHASAEFFRQERTAEARRDVDVVLPLIISEVETSLREQGACYPDESDARWAYRTSAEFVRALWRFL